MNSSSGSTNLNCGGEAGHRLDAAGWPRGRRHAGRPRPCPDRRPCAAARPRPLRRRPPPANRAAPVPPRICLDELRQPRRLAGRRPAAAPSARASPRPPAGRRRDRLDLRLSHAKPLQASKAARRGAPAAAPRLSSRRAPAVRRSIPGLAFAASSGRRPAGRPHPARGPESFSTARRRGHRRPWPPAPVSAAAAGQNRPG